MLISRIILIFFLSVAAQAADEVNLIAFGDWGSGASLQQRQVAQTLINYVAKLPKKPDAALLLGDNFYGGLTDGAKDKRWQTEFEQMYPADKLPFPFYALPGNHDYEGAKFDAQLDYAKTHPQSRWKLPSKWYRVEFPTTAPLVTVLLLDSNAALGGSEAWASEKKWVTDELARPRNWTVVAAHHPVYSNGQHGDNGTLRTLLAPLFSDKKIAFYLAGHDHDLQHLEIPNSPISWLTDGGGGASLRPMTRNDRGPFSRSLGGFVHLQFTRELATVKFIDPQGKIAHWAERTPDGKVTVKSTTGCDKPEEYKGSPLKKES